MSLYIVEISNSFNPGMQLKDTECANRNNLKDLLKKLKRFENVATLVLEFKKVESDH